MVVTSFSNDESAHENFLTYKKGKNFCNSLNKKSKKDYFKKATANGVMSNRKFWITAIPFLTLKGFLHNDNISSDINGNIVEDEQKLTKEFNSYYINIAKTPSGKAPMKLENNLDYINDSLITKRIIEKYKNHPSIKAIQDTFPVKKAKFEEINKILRIKNSRKATGPGKIPPKIVKMSANIMDSHLTNIINSDVKRNAFPDLASSLSLSNFQWERRKK